MAGKIAGDEAANTDSDGDCGLQLPAIRFGKLQNIRRIEDDVELQKRSQKPEICIAEHGKQKSTIGADPADLTGKVTNKIESESAGGVGCRDTADSQAGKQPHQ